MPLAAAIVPAVIGAGSALYSSSQASKASAKADAAAQAAAAQQLAAQQANFDRIAGLNQPFIAGGQGAYAKLLQQFGITPAGGAPTSPLAAPAGAGGGYGPGVNNYAPPGGNTTGGNGPSPSVAGGATPGQATGGAQPAPTGPAYPGAPQIVPADPGHFDADAYLAEYPDVMANAQQRVADGTAASVQQVAQEHYNAYGKGENRDNPMTAATPGRTVTPDLMNTPRPDAAAAPTFGDRKNLDAPDLASYFSNFEADPGAAYRRTEALNGVNAASAVRGKLRSGDAAKALATLASDLGSQEYNNWFSRQQTKFNDAQGQYTNQQARADTNYGNDRAYGTSLWQYGTDRGDRNFNTDRDYQTGQYNQNTTNLFNLTDVGTRAAANVSGAGTNFANAASDTYGNSANSTGAAAYNRAAANSYGANGVANAATNLFASWGGSSPTLGGYSNPGSGYGQPGSSPFTLY